MVYATEVIEDAEDGTTDGWMVRSGQNATIANIFDEDSQSFVIRLNGNGTRDSYILGAERGANAWNNQSDRFITWRMRFEENSVVYIAVQTTFGLRYLFYTPSHNRGLLHGFPGGIHHGLGSAIRDGRWRTITRDLERDLKDAEPDNDLISVNAFLVRGSGLLDDIILYNPNERVYDNGNQGTTAWRVSDNRPEGARIVNIDDDDLQGRQLQGRVLSLEGAGIRNAYRIGDSGGDAVWNNRDHQIFQWRFRGFGPEVEVFDSRGIIRDDRAFEFRIYVRTAQGKRELLYTLGAQHQGVSGRVIHHGLGDDRIRGSVWAGDDPINELGLWQTVTRDLEEDIRDFEPNNRLIAINGFQVRGSGLIDDIKTFSRFSGEDYNRVVYEDAEDGDTQGWQIYDDRTGGGAIRNIIDDEKGSRVIKLKGDRYNSGYMIGGRTSANGWNNQTAHTLEWSMNYSEGFVIYIPVETSSGQRYLVYTPRDDDKGVSGQYIRLGLGADADNGTWQTFARNIAEDLARFEPENELLAINGFMIRGTGFLDDIALISEQ